MNAPESANKTVEAEAQRKPYVRPTLEDLGDLRTLIQGGQGSGSDQVFPGKPGG